MSWFTTTKLGRWVAGDAVALDEAGNAAFLDGDAHETISAHCGAQITLAPKTACLFCRTVCKVLGWFFKDHCLHAWVDEAPMVAAGAKLPGAHGGKV